MKVSIYSVEVVKNEKNRLIKKKKPVTSAAINNADWDSLINDMVDIVSRCQTIPCSKPKKVVVEIEGSTELDNKEAEVYIEINNDELMLDFNELGFDTESSIRFVDPFFRDKVEVKLTALWRKFLVRNYGKECEEKIIQMIEDKKQSKVMLLKAEYDKKIRQLDRETKKEIAAFSEESLVV